MTYRQPISNLRTHDVTNQPPPLEDFNAFSADTALVEALDREGAGWAEERVKVLGEAVGSAHVIELGRLANTHPPKLRTFDRYGHRIDQVDYHPAYHELMQLGIGHQIHSMAWTANRPGGHAAHAAMLYLLAQAESGVCCPLAMTYAVVPALRHQPEVAAEWEPRILNQEYDSRFIPAGEKRGVTFGMAMTEKQGGSDVRANTTRATPLSKPGPGQEYELSGHKWFCSAPMSDAFLTLAQAEGGLTCFLVPRWHPDGSRNRFFIQRLKDKLGNRSNASSEIEYDGTRARMIGGEGRGVATIIEMVHHTRLDASLAAAALMRQAVVQAIHHTSHRSSFGKLLAEQPLMRNVLADLALESEAATAMAMRIARGFDDAQTDEQAQLFTRIATAVTKYWINKRCPAHVYEALECLGGAGYVEESIMPRLYREAPLNSIWEGSGNVICLDVLRALAKAPETFDAFLAELEQARGGDPRLDAGIEGLKKSVPAGPGDEGRARQLVGTMAVLLQAALLVQHAPTAMANAFCASRLEGQWGHTFGTLNKDAQTGDIIARAGVRTG